MAEVMSASAIDSAQNLAGKSIFLEMGARLGVIDLLMQDEPFDAQRVVRVSGASRHESRAIRDFPLDADALLLAQLNHRQDPPRLRGPLRPWPCEGLPRH